MQNIFLKIFKKVKEFYLRRRIYLNIRMNIYTVKGVIPMVTEADEISYGKWCRCVSLINEDIEVVATLDFGPRIMRFGAVGC